MISDNNKELYETDKLFKKLIAPSLRNFRLDTHVHQHHGPLKIDPVLLPYRSTSNGHGTLQASKASHSFTRTGRTPPATEMMLNECFPKISGQASSSAVDFRESFIHPYAASGLRGQQHRIDTSLSSASSTTKMKQLPLPQVQSSDALRSTSSPSPRGKKNVSVCSDRYLGTSRVGQQQQLHRRSRSAPDVLFPMSSSASSSEQVQRYEEERIALLRTKSLRRSTELMAHRKDRKYHMCGSGLPLFNRYLVDSEEMDRLRQLTWARSSNRGSSPVSYYNEGYGGRVTSGHFARQKKFASPSQEQKEDDTQGQEIVDDNAETKEVEHMMPHVKISRTLKKKNGKDAFLTELDNPEAGDNNIEDMFGNFKGENSGMSASQAVEPTAESTAQDSSPQTAEEALVKMLISDDKIAAMEDGLKKINLLKGGMEKVGRLEESELDLDDFKADDEEVDYGEEVFGKVRSDEELKEIERRRAKKREERSAKAAKKAENTIVAEAKVSEAKSKMADIYNFISSRQQEVFEKKFEDLDTDGNGVITLKELFSRMYKGKDKDTGRAFMQVFDLNKDNTIEQREFIIVAALNDKLSGKLTESLDSPLELDLEMLAKHITAYKRKLASTPSKEQDDGMETTSCHDNTADLSDEMTIDT